MDRDLDGLGGELEICKRVARPGRACWLPLGFSFLGFTLLLASCAAPTLEVRSLPAHAAIHMDGAKAGEATALLEPAYYGTVLIHCEEQIGEAELAAERTAFYGAKAQLVDFSAPVTPWLFGIDLIGEALVRVFGDMDEKVELELPLVEPKSEAALETLIEESEASSIAR